MTTSTETPPLDGTAKIAPPWEALDRLIESGEAEAAMEFWNSVPRDERNIAICRVKPENQVAFVSALAHGTAATVIEQLPRTQSVSILEVMDAADAAGVLTEMPADEQADFVAALDLEESEAILGKMGSGDAKVVRELIQYPPLSAGGLMSPSVIHFAAAMTVGDALRQMAAEEAGHAEVEIQYFYVVDEGDQLVGVVPLRKLMRTKRSQTLGEVMIARPLSVAVSDPLEAILPLFDQHSFLGLPVVDEAERLVGVVARGAAMKAKENKARSVFLKVSGIVGGDELRTLPLRTRCARRLAFLVPNILLNLVAASVIAMYQDTLAAVIALAVFLPIISDMSGCSGNQAVAVSIRELALGLIRPREAWRVFRKEAGIGLVNGLVLGLLLGSVAGLWQQNVWLGALIGGALALNTLLSVLLGGLVPLALKGAKIDPALASGPILTTATDMCGFFLVLNFAGMLLPKLV